MSKYRITVKEILDNGTTRRFYFDKENAEKAIKCDGFVIIGIDHDKDEKFSTGSTVAIQDVNAVMIAESICHHKNLGRAARLSRAIEAIQHLNSEEADDAAY